VHCFVALGLLDRRAELLASQRADRVHLLRAVEPDPPDSPFRLDLYVLFDSVVAMPTYLPVITPRNLRFRGDPDFDIVADSSDDRGLIFPLNTPFPLFRNACMPSFWSSVEKRK